MNSYNSAVFVSATSNNYNIYSVPSTFASSNARELNYNDVTYLVRSHEIHDGVSPETIDKAVELQQNAANGDLVFLDNIACMKAYTQSFQSMYSNVVLITDRTDNNVSVIHSRFYQDWLCGSQQAFQWTCTQYYETTDSSECPPVCDSSVSLQKMETNAQEWKPLDETVQHCLAQETAGRCQLQFSLGIAIPVIVFNAIKAIVMLYMTVFPLHRDPPLLTVGDAVASFLSLPDPFTEKMCLRTKPLMHSQNTSRWKPGAVPFNARRGAWRHAVSERRWFLCMSLFVISPVAPHLHPY